MEKSIAKVFDDIQYHDMREMILSEGRRLDGRGTKDIRPISCEVGVSAQKPRLRIIYKRRNTKLNLYDSWHKNGPADNRRFAA